MKNTKWFYLLFVAAFGATPVLAEEAVTKAPAPKADQKAEAAAAEDVDEDWLNTMWTQVDDMVKEEEFKLQETVTVAGVRGAEAEDNILSKLYYKGGKRYPSQDKLNKAIKTLRKALAKNPKSANAPKQKFFVAQCYEKLGQAGQARDFYTQITKNHSQSPYATKAQNKLSQLSVQ
jgi:tetratricopeptide (TPR) repeat protein